jgi:hypothetical protein
MITNNTNLAAVSFARRVINSFRTQKKPMGKRKSDRECPMIELPPPCPKNPNSGF